MVALLRFFLHLQSFKLNDNLTEEADIPLKSFTPYFVAFCVVLGTALMFISEMSLSETFANRQLTAILFCFIFTA